MVALRALTLGLLASQVLAMPAPQQAPTELPTTASSNIETAASQLEQLANFAINVTTETVSDDGASKRSNCTPAKLRVRREWRTFSTTQKKAYINSVLCLQKLPARTPAGVAPGAKSRYDDFVATHINQTTSIHYTGTFLAWHRYFIYEFEQALREECGYSGDYPYWNWPLDAPSVENSPVFDGSDTSMSGNGEYIPGRADIQLTLGSYPAINLTAGTGGGCVTSGPFKDFRVNLGPAALALPDGQIEAVSNPLAHNPRCLKRDLSTAVVSQYANFPAVVKLLLESTDIATFQMTMQGVPGSGSIGVHGGGHYAMGGDPGRDVFTSPGDPAFWLHHGMIDRVWWIWQSLDLRSRQNAISGTGTFLNVPASPDTTLDTLVDIGYANGGLIAMRDLMSTTGGPFCYVYL